MTMLGETPIDTQEHEGAADSRSFFNPLDISDIKAIEDPVQRAAAAHIRLEMIVPGDDAKAVRDYNQTMTDWVSAKVNSGGEDPEINPAAEALVFAVEGLKTLRAEGHS